MQNGQNDLTESTCIPASADCPSLVFLDSRAICRGSRQRSLQEDKRVNTCS